MIVMLDYPEARLHVAPVKVAELGPCDLGSKEGTFAFTGHLSQSNDISNQPHILPTPRTRLTRAITFRH